MQELGTTLGFTALKSIANSFVHFDGVLTLTGFLIELAKVSNSLGPANM